MVVNENGVQKIGLLGGNICGSYIFVKTIGSRGDVAIVSLGKICYNLYKIEKWRRDMKRLLRMAVIALLLGACCWLLLPNNPASDVLEVPTIQQTQTSPTVQSSQVPSTEQPVDTGALIGELAERHEDLGEGFLQWLLEDYGMEVLLDLQNALENGYSREIWYAVTGNTYHVLTDLYTGKAETQDNIHYLSSGKPGQENDVTSMVFGGDICLADNYLPMQYLSGIGGGIESGIDPILIEVMQSADIAFLNNEFTISDRGAPMKDKYYTFRAKTANTAIYNTLGVDIVSLANNHAFDYGEMAFLDTLDSLAVNGIAQIGGGRDLQEAMRPQYYIVNGRKIAFVAATRAEKFKMTPEATENSPGVLRCYDTALFCQAIAEAKKSSDFVVACVHWGTEYSYELQPEQTGSAREYIDAGADLIIGAHAHQLQGIEFYNGKAIFYNLGNFWFNSKEIDTGLLKVELDHEGSLTYTFLPALQKDCVTTSQIDTDRGTAIIKNLLNYCINVSIDENGLVKEIE